MSEGRGGEGDIEERKRGQGWSLVNEIAPAAHAIIIQLEQEKKESIYVQLQFPRKLNRSSS